MFYYLQASASEDDAPEIPPRYGEGDGKSMGSMEAMFGKDSKSRTLGRFMKNMIPVCNL